MPSTPRPTRRRFPGRTVVLVPSALLPSVLLPIVLAAALLALVACGTDETEPAGRLTDHHLDPPGLADLEAGRMSSGVPVLCYHYFRPGFDPGYLLRVAGSVLLGLPALGPREFWTTPVGEFEKHLRYFRDAGIRCLTLDEVETLVATGEPLPERAVVLTIDDADRSVYTQAWPLLVEYGVTAHLFVPTGHVGRKWSGLDVCSWDELRRMQESGAVLVESHTRNLHYKIATSAGPEPVFWHPQLVAPEVSVEGRQTLAALGEAVDSRRHGPETTRALTGPLGAVAIDLLASRVEIARHVGRVPGWLAWPYGFADDRLDSIAAVVGFRGTVSLKPAAYATASSSWQVGRFALTAKSSLDRIAAVVEPAPLP